MSKSSITQLKRSQLLNQVKQEIKEQQFQSLHRLVLVNLAQEKSPELWRRTWDLELKIGRHPTLQLPPQITLRQIFQQTQRQLLILGNPGGGKTTSLLQLGRRLLISAQKDEQAPIPVFFNLSSWQANGQGITPWFIQQLQFKYKIKPEIAQSWLAQNQLILLLDGLEQLKFPEQEFCIQAINRWLESEATHQSIVITANLMDYQKCQTRLKLKAALLLKKLTEAQIETYLKATRSRELWHNIETQPQLLKLARIPILLTMMTLSYEEILIESWKRLTTDSQRRQYLCNAYIRRQLSSHDHRPGQEPTPEQTRRWLIWLAQRLQESQQQEWGVPEYPVIGFVSPTLSRIAISTRGNPQENYTDFTLDKLSPQWLQTPEQQQEYERGVRRLTGLLILLFIGGIVTVFTSVVWGIMSGILAGMISGLFLRIGAIEKLILRWIFWKRNYLPWNYQRFLNYATSRSLLQRVNHRYQFIHRILQEHLSQSSFE